jgi:N-ethylmaleimide reductase
MKLFDAFNLSDFALSSRVVMAPLTRRRSTRNNAPVSFMADYYGQRASAGLIISEGTSPSPHGVGYCNMPGLFNEEQLEAWKPCTRAVHERGGKIFLQVMHSGRIGHPNNLPENAKLLGPSAIAQVGEISTYDYDKQAYPKPEAMTREDVNAAIQEFVTCSHLAMQAGFDGIEIHGAHGYLPNQFINASSNIRTDEYGGTRSNRLRFLLDVIDGCAAAIGAEKVGLRISPFSYADVQEDPIELETTYKELVSQLNTRQLAYLHLSHMGEGTPQKFNLWKEIRKDYNGSLILCGDFTKETAEKALQENEADLIAFGRDFIANPDLVERLKNNWTLAERDRAYWYTLGKEGYSDYKNYNKH